MSRPRANAMPAEVRYARLAGRLVVSSVSRRHATAAGQLDVLVAPVGELPRLVGLVRTRPRQGAGFAGPVVMYLRCGREQPPGDHIDLQGLPF